MGTKDMITKKYMSNPVHFADFFNGILYGGEQVINPDSLQEKDTTEIVMPFARGKKSVKVQKFRDVLKSSILMQSETNYYVLLGVENQSDVHYAMPVRNMLYNAITYANQVDLTSKVNKDNGNIGEENFLSGFAKTDKIMPVITLTLYWGDKPWDGPTRLKEMLEDHDPKLDRYIDDCDINLFSIVDEVSFEQFQSTLRQVFMIISSRNNGEKLRSVVNSDKAFENIDKESAELIGEFANLKIKKIRGGGYNVCKAVMEIKAEGRAEGIVMGEDKLGRLIQRLISDKRNDDVLLASTDEKARKKLYGQYGMID